MNIAKLKYDRDENTGGIVIGWKTVVYIIATGLAGLGAAASQVVTVLENGDMVASKQEVVELDRVLRKEYQQHIESDEKRFWGLEQRVSTIERQGAQVQTDIQRLKDQCEKRGQMDEELRVLIHRLDTKLESLSTRSFPGLPYRGY